MNQLSLASGLERATKRTRKRQFLEEMLAVVPWDALVARIAPHAPPGTTGRPPYPVLVLLRIHCLQQWFSLADEAVEDALHDVPVYRAFAGIDPGRARTPAARTPQVPTITPLRLPYYTEPQPRCVTNTRTFGTWHCWMRCERASGGPTEPPGRTAWEWASPAPTRRAGERGNDAIRGGEWSARPA